MTSPFDDSPEDLVRLRTTVRDWVEISRDALETFRRKDNSFLRDSKADDQNESQNDAHVSLTTTARSYMALANADRFPSKSNDVTPPEWVNHFLEFLNKYKDKIAIDDKGLKEIYYKNKKSDDRKKVRQTNFDLAHVADFVFALNYIERFYPSMQQDIDSLKDDTWRELCDQVGGILVKSFSSIKGMDNKQKKTSSNSGANKFTKLENIEGQTLFENSEQSSRHSFVTLHSLRALTILKPNYTLTRDNEKKLTEFTRKFCAQQCFYAQRRNRHQQDIFRLTFSGVIYSLYGQHVDKSLCIAIIEALAAAQHENGSWPASHPIVREGNKRPWLITSHEIALCLTWLYFQPRVPDVARPILLAMMEKYFTSWVIPTFIRVHKKNGEGEFRGWFDDHIITYDFASAWVSAIVCHFLANYHSVLDDHINRRVIETLALQACSSKYLIDETEHEISPTWRKPISTTRSAVAKGPWRATWPDLPPFAWVAELSTDQLGNRICWAWTDPQPGNRISRELAVQVLSPIFKNPSSRPNKDLCAGILPGKPGTGKTTLVKKLAEILEWPLVTVPASVIFEQGFDSMEARANEVFRRLRFLTGCVIFFDEFEEFFRSRDDGESPIHDRTIAAFTTSAMLPRLQDLHDEGRCLIFLATNDEQKIDNAIKRPGRFDFRITINHPNKKRILEYLKAPTRRTLRSLGFCVDDKHCRISKKHKKEYLKISSAVKDAICRLFDSEEEIQFNFVENALRAVAHPNAKRTKRSREIAATDSLRRSRKLARDSEGGPQELWDI